MLYGNTIIRVYSYNYKWCDSSMTSDGKRLGKKIAEVQQDADVSATELLKEEEAYRRLYTL